MAAEWPSYKVQHLQADGRLFVEDGNHGENRPRLEEFVEYGTPFVRAADLGNGRILFERASMINSVALNRIRKGLSRGGDVILSHKGTVGKVAMAPADSPPFVCSPQTTLWRSLNGDCIDRRYLYYFLKSPEFTGQLNAVKGETDMADYVSLTAQRNMSVRVPPIAIQRTIAHILGTLDDKIELNRRMNETLEAMARALFKSWFVDFEPVRAKAEGRDTGLPKHIADLFPDRLQESELGEIPEGWCLQTIDSLADLNAWTLRKDDRIDRIEYIEISEVSHGNIGRVQSFERGGEPSRARRRLHHGDTVLSTVRPERSSYFLCLNPSPSLIASTGFAVLTPTMAPWSFVHAAVTQEAVFEHLGLMADGGAYPAVRPGIIGQWQVPWPNEQGIPREFHCICAPYYERAEENRRESKTLAAIRDALLPKLLSGEIRVKDSEKFAEARP